MPDPEWFFSTLIQANAAIAGLVIAFSAVLYQLQNQRRQDRTQILREELRELKRKYGMLMAVISGELVRYISMEEVRIYNRLAGEEGIFELVELLKSKSSIDKPHTALLWLYTSQTAEIIYDIEPSEKPQNHFLLTVDEISRLSQLVRGLNRILGRSGHPDGFVDEIYEEISTEARERTDIPFNGATEQEMNRTPRDHANLFGDGPISSEYPVRDFFAKELEENIVDEGSIKSVSGSEFTGQDLRSFRRVFRELYYETEYLNIIKENTILTSPNEIGSVLKASGSLLVVGVFLPMIFLISHPYISSLVSGGGGSIVIIQLSVLLSSVVITGHLLWLIYKITYSGAS